MNRNLEAIELDILEEFEECKQLIKDKASPQMYYLLLELKEIYKLKGINFSKGELDAISTY